MAELDFGNMDWDSLEKNLGGITKEKKNYSDDRFWKLSRDENESGGAIIRLIPDPEGRPFIQRYSHTFQSFDNVNKKKRFYINISPETVEQPCPVSELWSKLYNLGTEEGQKEAKKFSRKIKYMTNIKVIKDPLNPQNEGKIFLWEFGTKLKDKFLAALKPSDAEIAMGESPKQLYKPMQGNNIKLKIKKAAGFFNYDDTEIMGESSIYDTIEEAKEDIMGNAYRLSEFTKPDAVETYAELQKKMKYVLEAYTPEFVDPVQFKSIVQEVVGTTQEEPKQATQPVQTTVEQPVQETATVQNTAPQEQAHQTTQSSAPSDDSLDFLDDL